MSATARIIEFPARQGWEPWLTKREVAERLRVSERWVELRVKDSAFPARKDPRSRLVRFRWSEVDQWMNERVSA